MVLPNSSIVLLSTIGEGSSALYCLTDRTQCCSNVAGGRRGAWKFPNGTDVSDKNQSGVYRIRGYSSLLLNRRRSAVGPTGVYTCLIPDEGDVLMTLYVGVYSDAAGGECHRQIQETRVDCTPQVHSLHHCPMIVHHIL